MKQMSNSKIRTLGKKELQAIFKSLRIKDGLAKAAVDGEFSYWYNKARDGRIGNYIIYEVIDSDVTYRADDVVIARDFYCQIDVFSISSFESKELFKFIERLENKLSECGFEVKMPSEEYEPNINLYHQIIYVSKLYF